jgi:hypothetical protein
MPTANPYFGSGPEPDLTSAMHMGKTMCAALRKPATGFGDFLQAR